MEHKKKTKTRLRNKSAKTRKHPSRPKGTIAALRENQDNFKTIVDNATDGVVINAASNGKVVYANMGIAKMIGYSADELLRTNIKDHFLPDRAADDIKIYQQILKETAAPNRYETAIIHKSGEVIPVEMTGSVVDWQGQKAIAVIIRDIRERKQLSDELDKHLKEKVDYLTYYDGLTGLLNRSRFITLLNEWIAASQNSVIKRGALLLLDIDQFKFVSDTYGYGMGDEFLRRMARLLQITLQYITPRHFNEHGKENILCRLAADEFAVFLPSADRAAGVEAAEQLRKNIEIFFQPDIPVHLTASIGVSLYPDHGDTTSELLTKADTAMFRAKDLGRNKIHFYSPDDRDIEQMHSRLAWKENILQAIKEDRFEIWFQPIVDLKDGMARHYEVLARMRSKGGGMVLPMTRHSSISFNPPCLN
ncbi:MAG: diguanylate cyclase [Deltaproteobacteria bacterium]|nr:diguanylate cyclase [Deltaproteobacteria bacterium]